MAVNKPAITVRFGGDDNQYYAGSLADLQSAHASSLFGYNASSSEFVRNGDVLTADSTLREGDVVSVRTRANTKG